jgi:spore coat polysaccharide biosynthesis predicted glycosyltransferase SpsG
MRIIVVTDGGVQMGMGHVHQSLTLSRELRSQADVRFLTKSDHLVVRAIAEAGFRVKAAADDEQIFALIGSEEPDGVLFDKIDVSVSLALRIRTSLRARLVIFTNLTAANDHAHMVVLPRAANLKVGPASRFENVAYRDLASGTFYFYGPAYWVLKKEFHEYRSLMKAPPGKIRRILLAFGGSDPSDLTARVLKELLGCEQPYAIDVVVGSHYAEIESLKQILQSHRVTGRSVRVHRNVSNVGELMYQADLAITAAGMTMFEALCVRTPVIVIPQDELQWETYDGVMRMLPRDQIGQLAELIQERDFSDPCDPFIESMRIGEGLRVLTDCILDQCCVTHSDAGSLLRHGPSHGKQST